MQPPPATVHPATSHAVHCRPFRGRPKFMEKSFVRGCAGIALTAALGVHAQTSAPIKASEVPPLPPRGTYTPVKTSWGDPAIAGAYNNSDETGIPFERPKEYDGRTLDS